MKRLSFARKIRLFGYVVLLIAVVELAVVSSVYDNLSGFGQTLLVTLGTDSLGVAVTVLILNALQERAQEEQFKNQLIREMRSKIRDVAVPAAEQIAARAWLRDGSLVGAQLFMANLEGACLGSANLEGACLVQTNLARAELIESNLARAELVEADLTEAMLDLANLQGADLTEAKLCEADLWAADLAGAHLEDADLTGAKLEGANLSEAV
jgi:uncharacterized protein YjbI with pentapeptide repeats